MKKGGWLVNGIEINEKARDFSKSHFGLEVNTPDRISRLLKPGAVCVVALPNCSSYDAEHYKQFWAAWDVPRHLWHFQPSTFRIFSEKSGFNLENLKILPLDVFYISLLSERYMGSSMAFLKAMSKAFIFALRSIFNRDRSSSIVYILRKPEAL